jgi:hypothetical protein
VKPSISCVKSCDALAVTDEIFFDYFIHNLTFPPLFSFCLHIRALLEAHTPSPPGPHHAACAVAKVLPCWVPVQVLFAMRAVWYPPSQAAVFPPFLFFFGSGCVCSYELPCSCLRLLCMLADSDSGKIVIPEPAPLFDL